MTPLGRAEHLLAAGLLSATAAAALVQLVLFGLIGLLLAPVALVLLILAGIRVRDAAVSGPRARAGLFVFLAGVVVLGYAAGCASSFGYSIVRHRTHPSELLPAASGWAMLMLWSVAASTAVAIGLGLRARWSRARLALWAGVVFCVPAFGLAGFLIAALAWPIGN